MVNLLGWWDLSTSIDLSLDIAWVLASDSAADRNGSSEDLLDSAREGLSHRANAHGASDIVELLHRDVTGVLDVLLLLAVALWLSESLDNQSGSRWDDLDLSDTVLDDQLDGDTETLVVHGRLGDIIGNLLGRLREEEEREINGATSASESCVGGHPNTIEDAPNKNITQDNAPSIIYRSMPQEDDAIGISLLVVVA